MFKRIQPVLILGFLLPFLVGGSEPSGCIPNHPHPRPQWGENIYYDTFDEEPKHLDPAISYSSDEYAIIGDIYEPPLDYHFLKRPAELVPLTVQEVPKAAYYDTDGDPLTEEDPSAENVSRVVYELKIKPGIRYQNHPCFAKGQDGGFLYHSLSAADVGGVSQVTDFEETGSRELTARDYALQIRRMADPRLNCPVLSIFEGTIEGMAEYHKRFSEKLEEVRGERKAELGPLYNQEKDEMENPIRIDYFSIPFSGAEVVDDRTLRITLKRKYPQFLYWLAMPFFSPIPQEAVDFHAQGVLAQKNITLDRSPVGTGPYRIDDYDPHYRIALARNENYHPDVYPTEGTQQDREEGFLKDAGKPMPFIEKQILRKEKEFIPRWIKFLQGYYDTTGITSDVFDQSIQVTMTGPELSGELRNKGIRLITNVRQTVYYFGFNMRDPTVGGYTPQQRKLRRAISIAMDMEEYVQIFYNGRGIPSHGPLPPGIFGYEEGKEGMNPYVYDWDPDRRRPVRKSIEEARRLLAEAGYPGGRGPDGRPLKITFDNSWEGSDFFTRLQWIRKRIEQLGINVEVRTTDYNRFREKVNTGNFQLLFWGWNADYPDAENFLFLLYGPNGKVEHHGENAVNYDSPQYNELFEKLETMENGPRRLELIREAVDLARRDSPWIFAFHPVDYTLAHTWVENVKPGSFASSTKKYRRIDPERRHEQRRKWNRPVLWPVWGVLAILVITALPAFRAATKHRNPVLPKE